MSMEVKTKHYIDGIILNGPYITIYRENHIRQRLDVL
jgi:hypothetical protein